MKPRPGQIVCFLLPWAVGFVALTLLPMLAALGLSFLDTDGGLTSDRMTWVGMQNYREALNVDRSYSPMPGDPWYWSLLGGRPGDPEFYTSLYNTLFYTFFAVPLGLCASLGVALLLNRPITGMSIVRGCVYLPHVLGGVATIVVFSWLFNPQFGWVNQILGFVYGLIDPVVRVFFDGGTSNWPVPMWLHSPAWCKPVVIIMHVWTMGGAMLVFLAALHRVAPYLHDAAQIDGAGRWHRFRHITLPQITPAVLFNLIFSFIFTMQSFSEAYLLQNREQGDGLLFYVLYLYQVAFTQPYRLGYASALSWILFVILLAVIVPLLWTSRKWVYYAVER